MQTPTNWWRADFEIVSISEVQGAESSLFQPEVVSHIMSVLRSVFSVEISCIKWRPDLQVSSVPHAVHFFCMEGYKDFIV